MRNGKHADLGIRNVLRLLGKALKELSDQRFLIWQIRALCLFSLLGTGEFSTAASHTLEGEAGLKGLNVLMDPNWTLLWFYATTALQLFIVRNECLTGFPKSRNNSLCQKNDTGIAKSQTWQENGMQICSCIVSQLCFGEHEVTSFGLRGFRFFSHLRFQLNTSEIKLSVLTPGYLNLLNQLRKKRAGTCG